MERSPAYRSAKSSSYSLEPTARSGFTPSSLTIDALAVDGLSVDGKGVDLYQTLNYFRRIQSTPNQPTAGAIQEAVGPEQEPIFPTAALSGPYRPLAPRAWSAPGRGPFTPSDIGPSREERRREC
jgi:hypothetical protein